MVLVEPSGRVSVTSTSKSVPIPLFVTVPEKPYLTDEPSLATAPFVGLQVLVKVMPHNGKLCGPEKSLRVALPDVEARVSARNVVKQGTLLPKIDWRSMPPSRNSPAKKTLVPFEFVKLHGEVIPTS